MRPRLISRGKVFQLDTPTHLDRFNEAATDQSRKEASEVDELRAVIRLQ